MDSNFEITFIERLANEVATHSDKSKIRVVLPNRRSLHYLHQNLSERNVDADLITVDDLMQDLAGIKILDPEELLVTFYEVYTGIENKPQSFDQFSTWAVTFLGDINDLDLHLGDADALYRHIHEFHQTGAYFSEDKRGPIESSFLSFWQRLPTYYHALNEALENLQLAYRGLVYRKVATLVQKNSATLENYLSDDVVFWVGIIPGNPSEHKLLNWLDGRSKLRLFADIDKHYLDNPNHEAGKLFRNQKLVENIGWTTNCFASISKQIHTHPMPGKTAQVERIKHLLENLDRAEWSNTVVVITNTSLLIPFLELMHEHRNHVNITLGFPMKGTLVHRFVMTWLNMHAGAIMRNGETLFYHKHLEEFLDFAIVRDWVSGLLDWSGVRKELVAKNMTFVPLSWLKSRVRGDLFGEKAFNLLFDWNREADSMFQSVSTLLNDWLSNVKQLSIGRLEEKALRVYVDKLKLLMAQFNEVLPAHDFRALRKFIHRQIGFSRIYFDEPENNALQVMGMLETRMIDFKNVIVLGASDDELPGSSHSATHIPFAHRVHFRLPTTKDSEALTAYHFYRLLQRAKVVHLIYNNVPDAFSSGEVSRYLLQLQEELPITNPASSFQFAEVNYKISAADLGGLSIKKSPEVLADIQKFLAKRVSPSALNKFINSPLDFYFFYVLGVKEETSVEEEIEVTTFGTVVHEALEKIYLPFEGKIISTEALKSHMNKTDELVEQLFLELFQETDLKKGKNLLSLEMAKQYVRQFIDFDIREMKMNGPVKLLKLEDKLQYKTTIAGVDVNLFGFADRVDFRQNVIRIIDYKTGTVNPAKLKFDTEKLPNDFNFDKAMQLSLYKYVYCMSRQVSDEGVEAAIFSFKSIKDGYMKLTPAMNERKTVLEAMPEILEEIILEMLNPDKAFEHRVNSVYTKF